MNEEQVRKIGLRIVQQFGAYGRSMGATRPTIEFKLAKARFEGMVEVAAIALGAPTPFAIELALIDAERKFGKMPAHSASNKEYREWEASMMRAFLEAHNIRHWQW